eukprot:7670839-Ditylum_brightwellii.AAC.1
MMLIIIINQEEDVMAGATILMMLIIIIHHQVDVMTGEGMLIYNHGSVFGMQIQMQQQIMAST